MATLQENPELSDILNAFNPTDLHNFNQLPISPHFKNAYIYIDPVVARYKSNRLRQGLMKISDRNVEAFGIYPCIASFPSSCTPNLHLRWTGNRMQLRAADDIPANTMLSISRELDWILAPRHIRHSRLLKIYGIDCTCQVGAGTPREIDQSDRTRGLIFPVVSGQIDPQNAVQQVSNFVILTVRN
jgi:hypothetical protein